MLDFTCIGVDVSLESLSIPADARISFYQSYMLIVEPSRSLRIVHHKTLDVLLRHNDSQLIDATLNGCLAFGFVQLTIMHSTTTTTYSIDLNTNTGYAKTRTLRAPPSFTFAPPLVVFPSGSLCAVVKSKEDRTFSVIFAKTQKIHQTQWKCLNHLRNFEIKPSLQLIHTSSQLLCTVGRRIFVFSLETMKVTFMTSLEFAPTSSFSLTANHLTFCKNESMRTLSIDNTTNSLASRRSTFFNDDNLKLYASHREFLYVVDAEEKFLSTYVVSTASSSDSLRALCIRVLQRDGAFTDITAISEQQSSTLLHTSVVVVEEEKNLAHINPPPSADGNSLIDHCLDVDDDDDPPTTYVPLECSSMTKDTVVFVEDKLTSMMNDEEVWRTLSSKLPFDLGI